MPFLRSKAGQSLTEYILIGSLVALVAYGGLALLGNSLSLKFSGLIAGERKALPPADSYLLSKGGGSSGGSVGSPASGSDADAAADGKSCVSEGFCLDLGKIETNEQSSTQTTGANGDEMIAEYSDVLEQIEAKLEEMPEVDPTLKQYIINSANAGHDIVTQNELGSSGSVNDATISFIYRSDDLRSFITQHPNALPAEVNEVIKLSLANIQKLSVGQLKKTTPNYYEFYQIPPNLQISTDEDFSLSDFAKKIKKNANTVCKAGNADPACTQ